MSNAERQRLYIQRLKARAASVTKRQRARTAQQRDGAQALPPPVTNDLSTAAKAKLKRLARA
jgi:hypothetical protein